MTTYLDVSPMITALRSSPDAFEFTRGSLHHIPSRHRFQFDGGGVRIAAQCSCSLLAVRKEQESSLVEAFNEWQASYWRPLEINKQFAAHFSPPSGWRLLLLWLTARAHRALLSYGRETHDHKAAAVPAE